jgi:hypothetical protein
MRLLRTVLVAVLLGSFFSPALGVARTEPRTQPVAAQPLAAAPAATPKAETGEAAQYQQREQQSQDLQNFKGGAVYLYFGSGVVLALIIIVLILL